MSSVVIVGAGIVGLSTAVRLQLAHPSVRVTILADKFGEDTTSSGAAGLFRPTPELIKGVDPQTLRNWIEESWSHYTELAISAEARDAGVFYVSGYHMYQTGAAYAVKPNLLEMLSPSYRQMTEKEWAMFDIRRPCGVFFTSLLIEPTVHLQWLMNRFLSEGGIIEQRTVKNFDEFAGKYDAVINCTGLRARDIEPDDKLVANRGQVLRVHAPWLKHFVYTDMDMWIIPCLDSVVVGGTRQHDDDDEKIRKQDIDDVWERACRAVPSLRSAKILKIWPGLRPYRSPLRLESERRKYGSKTLQILHHYGHGGNGIGISWGTAGQAVAMLSQILGNQSKL